MPLLLAFNGYLTIAGLVLSGIGSLVQIFSPETGTELQNTGLGLAGLGQLRRGVLQYKATP
jgi:hypothetical protein